MKRRIFLPVFITLLVIISGISDLFAMPVDLTEFTIEPGSIPVATPQIVTLNEVPETSPVSLENWNLVIPSDALTFSFYYELFVAENNEDYFDFYIFDTSTPEFSDGGLPGTYSGTRTYDLTGLQGDTIPVIFALTSGWWGNDSGIESYLTINYVNITQAEVAVPEPATLLLLLGGVAGLVGFNRRKLRDSE